MKTVIDGVEVELPRKLSPRMAEIVELVDMVKRLAQKKGKTVNCIHVWETKRHELCYADFTASITPSPEPVNLKVETYQPTGVHIESEEKMDLILAERGKTLGVIEMSMKVLDTEKQCVERQYNGMCDNKRDCANCDLALGKDEILLGYERALKCLRHLRDLVMEM